jgi:hypothetical protein
VSIAEQFATAAEDLLARDETVERGRMLQSPGLRSAGRFFAFVTTSDLVVKLPAGRVAELVHSGTGRPCEIRHGAPMREWVRLSPTDPRSCARYLSEACDYVSQLGR